MVFICTFWTLWCLEKLVGFDRLENILQDRGCIFHLLLCALLPWCILFWQVNFHQKCFSSYTVQLNNAIFTTNMITYFFRFLNSFSFSKGMTSTIWSLTFIVSRTWTIIYWIFSSKPFLSIHFDTCSFFYNASIIGAWPRKTIDIYNTFRFMSKWIGEILFISWCLIGAWARSWWNNLFNSLFVPKNAEFMRFLNLYWIVIIGAWWFL